jgi:hypothetical protein
MEKQRIKKKMQKTEESWESEPELEKVSVQQEERPIEISQ